MRVAVVNSIYLHALKHPEIVFITADQSHAHIDDFKNNIPGQYINVGIAEQNMMGIASGLALSGHKVFVFAITPFATLRCYEQIKIDICYQNVDVTIIGIGAGYVYGTSGSTHHAIEDIAVMRALPNMHIYSPSNPYEARLLTEHILIDSGHPSYLRIAKENEPMPPTEYAFDINKGLVMKPGEDVTIFSTGIILTEALAAAAILDARGISTEVINLHTLKPLDLEIVANRISKRRGLYILEEHITIGGLGEAIAKIVAEAPAYHKPVLKCFGAPDSYSHVVGTQRYMWNLFGLTGAQVAEEISKLS